jgi:hypothetical protein
MINSHKTQIILKDNTILETTTPVVYTGNFVLITQKTTSDLGETAIITSEVKPFHLSEVKTIITHNQSKKYNQL